MPAALVISASQDKVEAGTESRSFEQIVSTGVGMSYAISDPDRRQIRIGGKVVILDTVGGKRAEARANKTSASPRKTLTGMQRYNVHFENAERVAYKYEKLKRWGTTVIDLP